MCQILIMIYAEIIFDLPKNDLTIQNTYVSLNYLSGESYQFQIKYIMMNFTYMYIMSRMQCFW